MKKTRLIISLAIIALLMISGMVVSHAATSGTTGGCDWKISSNVLEISIAKSTDGTVTGDGKMADYTSASATPWYSNRSSIKSIVVDDSVVYIGNYAFAGLTSVTEASIGLEVEGIGILAFSGCSKLATLDFYASKCEKAGGSADARIFYKTVLSTINFGDDVKYIPPYMFLQCTSLTSVTIPESVYYIGEYAFGYCTKLESIVLPDKLAQLPEYMFYKCEALVDINVPKMLTNIGNYTFHLCSALPELELPATITEIGYGAFEECTSLHITTTKGSYAALFAEQYGIEYTATGSATGSSGVDLYVSTNTHVMRNNNGFTLGAKFDQELNGECVHAAFYDVNGNVVNYIIFPIFGTMDNINMYVSDRDVSTAKYAKIFIWDSIDSCQPISAPETVQLYPEVAEGEVTEG